MQSIDFRKKMDARVKPAHDEGRDAISFQQPEIAAGEQPTA